MGKKKKKTATQEKAWCYYCDKEFVDEHQLIQHQKVKHFKCTQCNKKFMNVPSMGVHLQQVHSITLKQVPNAVEGRRDNVSLDISGMRALPQNDVHVAKRMKLDMSLPPVGYPIPPPGMIPPIGGMMPPPAGMLPPPGLVPPPYGGMPPGMVFQPPPIGAPGYVVPPGVPPPTAQQTAVEKVPAAQRLEANVQKSTEAEEEEEEEDFEHRLVGLVYRFEMTSMEEKRAMLPKYAYDASNTGDHLSRLDAAMAA
eukprot:CAMPEP_0203792168 /NCGR_PEP_ID=MMETSP0100_2-20121128/5086_1 /ASSEMBLY_ACC=CAM_ASM_000210 /TAXON_ID=96639 /ORGANISM=" , Strain NY0313808BC1" /LENGTH=252 /DNA_ID=CAMNT_0050695659 /DNA_START=8 /DNA_END=762 /DNA_ORIENTATION=-